MQAVFYLINRLDGTECELDDGTESASSESNTTATPSTDTDVVNSGMFPLHVYGQINGYTTDMIIMVDTPNITDEDSFFNYLEDKGKLVFRRDSGPEMFSTSRTGDFTSNIDLVCSKETLTLVHMINGGDSFYGANALIFVQDVDDSGNDLVGEYENSKSECRGSYIYELRSPYEISDNGGSKGQEWYQSHVTDDSQHVFIRTEDLPRMSTSHQDVNYNYLQGLTFHYDMDVLVYNG